MVNLWYSSHRHSWYVAGCGYFPSTVKQTNKGLKYIKVINSNHSRLEMQEVHTNTKKNMVELFLIIFQKEAQHQPFPHSAGQVTPWCFLGFSERSLVLADLRSDLRSLSFCLATKSFMMSTGFATSDGCQKRKFPLKVTEITAFIWHHLTGNIWLNHILNPMESE